jgi:uncharacterized oligopeptide transporter (OPT) family protein
LDENRRQYVISGSSGLIAGESLMGVAVILWVQGSEMLRAVWHLFFSVAQ